MGLLRFFASSWRMILRSFFLEHVFTFFIFKDLGCKYKQNVFKIQEIVLFRKLNSMTEITAKELKSSFLRDYKLTVTALEEAVIDECCENILINEGVKDLSQSLLTLIVGVSYSTALAILKSHVRGQLTKEAADTFTLTYRGQTFVIHRASGFLKA